MTANRQETVAAFSEGLADLVEKAAASVVRVAARPRVAGTGVAWSAEGLVLTAEHLLEQDEVTLGLPDGQQVGATVLGRDPATDLALLRAGSSGLAVLPHGPAPRVGNMVVALARPFAEASANVGIVMDGSHAARRPSAFPEGVISTNITMYPGFSGGPLVDAQGRMVGLLTSRFGSQAGVALPLATVQRVAADLLDYGWVRRGYLGVRTQPVPLSAALRATLGAEQGGGLLVMGVEQGSAAERGGIILGDILVALDGQAVQGPEDLRVFLSQERIGRPVSLRVLRGVAARDVTVTVGERQ
ncbi:MAG: PDZ domain-containing protein [Dehalococcoidia bacterium]|nr:PDZ domain-containing protein [Dehalococcoidia bacterium]